MKWTIEKFNRRDLNPDEYGMTHAAIKIDPFLMRVIVDWHAGAGFDSTNFVTGPDVTRKLVKDVKPMMTQRFINRWMLENGPMG